MRDAGEDYKSIVLGLKFGGVPSINSLESVYHFQVREFFDQLYKETRIIINLRCDAKLGETKKKDNAGPKSVTQELSWLCRQSFARVQHVSFVVII
jgi:hypothetical protein